MDTLTEQGHISQGTCFYFSLYKQFLLLTIEEMQPRKLRIPNEEICADFSFDLKHQMCFQRPRIICKLY
jgi:hypothetical protein